MSSEINECRKSQREFFDARRKIGVAAMKIAENHKIDLQMMDEDDSDDERHNYYENLSTNASAFSYSPSTSPRGKLF